MEMLEDAYEAALDRASLEAFEGMFDTHEIEKRVDAQEIKEKALELVWRHKPGIDPLPGVLVNMVRMAAVTHAAIFFGTLLIAPLHRIPQPPWF